MVPVTSEAQEKHWPAEKSVGEHLVHWGISVKGNCYDDDLTLMVLVVMIVMKWPEPTSPE